MFTGAPVNAFNAYFRHQNIVCAWPLLDSPPTAAVLFIAVKLHPIIFYKNNSYAIIYQHSCISVLINPDAVAALFFRTAFILCLWRTCGSALSEQRCGMHEAGNLCRLFYARSKITTKEIIKNK